MALHLGCGKKCHVNWHQSRKSSKVCLFTGQTRKLQQFQLRSELQAYLQPLSRHHLRVGKQGLQVSTAWTPQFPSGFSLMSYQAIVGLNLKLAQMKNWLYAQPWPEKDPHWLLKDIKYVFFLFLSNESAGRDRNKEWALCSEDVSVWATYNPVFLRSMKQEWAHVVFLNWMCY